MPKPCEPPALSVERFSYSRSPWRITLGGAEFWPCDVPLCFARKRDAVPFVDRLNAVGDWSDARSFTAEQISRVKAIVVDTESYRLLEAVRRRQAGNFI
jgi:hypothetical protein